MDLKGLARQKIVEVLNHWIFILGIPVNNRPDELTFKLIVNFFIDKMNYVTPDQLILAIDLANQKKFECDLTLYGRTFSVGYIAPIVTAYLEYEKTIKDTKIIEKTHQLAEKSKMTNEEIAEANDKLFKDGFTEFLKTGWFEDYGNVLHGLLVQNGKIGVLTHEKYTDEAKIQLESRYDLKTAINVFEANKFKKVLTELENNTGTELEILSKKICINKYFEAKQELLIKMFGV